MGEAADDMIDGDACETCGKWLGGGEGFPDFCCEDCANEADDYWELEEERALRDRFAGQAMQSLIVTDTHWPADKIAAWAWEFADAMLAAREKKPEAKKEELPGKSEQKKGVRVLPASEVAIGHCVNINHAEQPCGRLVAVVIRIEGGWVRAKYLNSESNLTKFNHRGFVNPSGEVTPIGLFGVEVHVETDEEGDNVYWCEPVGESVAKYHDGAARYWQERGWRGRFVARPDVLRIAESTQ